MELPNIDISSLPDLDQLTGVFGSISNPAQAMFSDDSIVIIMAFVYELMLGY